MIKLTLKSHDEPIWLSVQHITAVMASGSGSVIKVIGEGLAYRVKEEVSEVLALIKLFIRTTS